MLAQPLQKYRKSNRLFPNSNGLDLCFGKVPFYLCWPFYRALYYVGAAHSAEQFSKAPTFVRLGAAISYGRSLGSLLYPGSVIPFFGRFSLLLIAITAAAVIWRTAITVSGNRLAFVVSRACARIRKRLSPAGRGGPARTFH